MIFVAVVNGSFLISERNNNNYYLFYSFFVFSIHIFDRLLPKQYSRNARTDDDVEWLSITGKIVLTVYSKFMIPFYFPRCCPWP